MQMQILKQHLTTVIAGFHAPSPLSPFPQSFVVCMPGKSSLLAAVLGELRGTMWQGEDPRVPGICATAAHGSCLGLCVTTISSRSRWVHMLNGIYRI